jgi:hypothetical protein
MTLISAYAYSTNGYDSVVKIKGASVTAALAPFVEVTGSIA